ncbi:MAG: sulfatase-like hydrolase/transferase, partial [Verrucomicrobiales bacterium]|nr:sulfatase-like hydrolase/transferase [Verrucomicrobiales bacterium]
MSFRLFCCLGLLSLSPLTAAPPPNVILILADDLGYGDLACYGHPLFQTPHLDQMAREGVRFTQFNCPSAFCAPTRSTLLTGRTPSRNGMRGNPAPDATPAADAMVLPASERLLPQVLGAAGYRADMLGKWHLGHQPGFLPTERGFESYFGIPYSNDMRPVRLLEGTQVAEEPAVQSTLTERYTQRACDLIRRHQDEPFFLYLAHAMPHKPLAVSPAFDGRTGHGLYADVIAELDASIGTLRQTLADTGLTERTLILFTSDNGPWFGGSTG